jgi:hypothetical protein
VCRRGEHEHSGRVNDYLGHEKAFGITSRGPYTAFADRVMLNKRRLRDLIGREVAAGKIIWAYGASAKGNTLVNFFEISNREVPVAIDDNSKKWGYCTPGAHMRITGIQELAENRVDYLLLLAWNFREEIIRRCQAAHYPGGYILPVPDPAIITNSPEGAH